MVDNLSTRFRPRQFSEILGQPCVNYLRTNAFNDTPFTCYLFSGPPGTGKTTSARVLCAALSCKNADEGDPCGKCDFCIDVTSGDHIDVHEINCASDRGIDVARRIVGAAQVRPMQAKYKSFILDEVHCLTKEAFSCLLKTLEEPPGNSFFILCTSEPSKIPRAIMNRCFKADFQAVPFDYVLERLKTVCRMGDLDFGELELQAIAQDSNGSIRRAESALLGSGVADPEDCKKDDRGLSLLQSLYKKEESKSMRLASAILKSGPHYAVELISRSIIEAITKKGVRNDFKVKMFHFVNDLARAVDESSGFSLEFRENLIKIAIINACGENK